MKMFVISDNVDTTTGLRLVGVEGIVVQGRNEFRQALDDVVANKSIGILLVVEGLCREHNDLINDIKINKTQPLVVEIPDRNGSGRAQDFISAYIREAIGVKLTS